VPEGEATPPAEAAPAAPPPRRPGEAPRPPVLVRLDLELPDGRYLLAYSVATDA
jgi:hypothetical protein